MVKQKILNIGSYSSFSSIYVSTFGRNCFSTHDSLFSVTLIAPGNANLLRRQWTQIFASNLQQLGIDAKVVYLGWTPVYDRVLTPPLDMVGKTYDQGGYDVLALGWTPGTVPEPRQVYYGGDASFFAPSGQNYYLWYNGTSNALLDNFITSTSDSEKASLLNQWQKVYYDDVPASQIMYQAAPAIVNPVIGNLYTSCNWRRRRMAILQRPTLSTTPHSKRQQNVYNLLRDWGNSILEPARIE